MLKPKKQRISKRRLKLKQRNALCQSILVPNVFELSEQGRKAMWDRAITKFKEQCSTELTQDNHDLPKILDSLEQGRRDSLARLPEILRNILTKEESGDISKRNQSKDH